MIVLLRINVGRAEEARAHTSSLLLEEIDLEALSYHWVSNEIQLLLEEELHRFKLLHLFCSFAKNLYARKDKILIRPRSFEKRQLPSNIYHHQIPLSRCCVGI